MNNLPPLNIRSQLSEFFVDALVAAVDVVDV